MHAGTQKLVADCLRTLYQTLYEESAHEIPGPVNDCENWAFGVLHNEKHPGSHLSRSNFRIVKRRRQRYIWRRQEMKIKFWWYNLLKNFQCEDQEIYMRITLIFILRRWRALLLAALKLCFLIIMRCHLSNNPTKVLISGNINHLKDIGYYIYHLLQH
jgi:hypothetical protein